MDQVTALANSGASGVVPIIMNFIALIVLTVVLFVFALRAGRPAFTSLILSFYIGFSLYVVFPWKAQFMIGDGMTKAVVAILLYVILSAIPFFVLRRVNTTGLKSIKPFPLLVLSGLSAGALLSVSYHFLNLAKILPATPPVAAYVVPEQYLFYWLMAPLIAFFVLIR